MDRGLLAPLSPHEEIALRRVAKGSVDIAMRHADRLMKLALVKRSASGLRLTAIGLQRLRALPGSLNVKGAMPDGRRKVASSRGERN